MLDVIFVLTDGTYAFGAIDWRLARTWQLMERDARRMGLTLFPMRCGEYEFKEVLIPYEFISGGQRFASNQ
jgi:hypothetical protein